MKIEVDANGNESPLITTENDGTSEPFVAWEGDVTEGLYYSLAFTMRDLLRFRFKDIAENKQRLTNVKLAMRDILVGVLIYNLMKLFFTGSFSGKDKDVDGDVRFAYRAVTKAANEFNPIDSIFGALSLEPAFYQTFVTLQNDGMKMMFGDTSLAEMMNSNISSLRDFDLSDV